MRKPETVMQTLDYYNQNAESFAQNTIYVDFHQTQDRFLQKLPKNSLILDFGCGAGRDTKYFLQKGYFVEPADGSEELCRFAEAYTGIPVKRMLFQELAAENCYDAIWACSSILHLEKKELRSVFSKMTGALKENGILYTSFKYGEFEGIRNGRYFTDFTETTFTDFIKDIPEIQIEETWITGDVRPGRGEEKWLNLILRKK